MFKEKTKDPYVVINLILAGIIILIFTYSGLFSPNKSNHPIPSNIKIISDQKTESTGLSRAFSAIVRMEFEEAKKYNRSSIAIFSFFLIQLIMRIIMIPVSQKKINRNYLIIMDISISTTLFILAFYKFIANMYQISLPG